MNDRPVNGEELRGTEAISLYEEIAEKSLRMLDAARESQWDELIQMEHERSLVFQKLMAVDSIDLGEARLNEKKKELLVAVMKSDTETQMLAGNWMSELRLLLNSANVEKKLGNAYFSAD
jgi:flagellar protein FliT